MNGGGEAASTGIKRDNTVACCFRLGFSNYRLVLDSVNTKCKIETYTSFSHYFKNHFNVSESVVSICLVSSFVDSHKTVFSHSGVGGIQLFK